MMTAMKNHMDMSIIVPTNRPLGKVESSLLNMCGLAASLGAEVIVSDNRGDELKTRALRSMFGGSYYVSPEPESVGNHSFAMSKSKTRFSWLLHDDDWISDLGGSLPCSIPDDFVGICPTIILASPPTGVYGIRNFDLCHDDPLARIRAYGAQSNGANSLFFAIWETELAQNIAIVNKLHPCPAGYQDWAMIQAMLAEGKVLSIDKLGYRYNNNNWYGPDAAVQEEIQSLMRRAHLPIELAERMGELRVLDLVCFLGRGRGYKQPISERYHVLNDILSKLITNYQGDQIAVYIDQILDRIRQLDPDAGNRYQRYIEQSLRTPQLEDAL